VIYGANHAPRHVSDLTIGEPMSTSAQYKVFLSHGSTDAWVARQLSKEIKALGAATFLDETDIPKGANFKEIIRQEISECNELLALFTPWSAQRSWVWSEVGAAWGQNKPVLGVLYGMSQKKFDTVSGGKAMFEDINVLDLNETEKYLSELQSRVGSQSNG
jgi:hypothetical protein